MIRDGAHLFSYQTVTSRCRWRRLVYCALSWWRWRRTLLYSVCDQWHISICSSFTWVVSKCCLKKKFYRYYTLWCKKAIFFAITAAKVCLLWNVWVDIIGLFQNWDLVSFFFIYPKPGRDTDDKLILVWKYNSCILLNFIASLSHVYSSFQPFTYLTKEEGGGGGVESQLKVKVELLFYIHILLKILF